MPRAFTVFYDSENGELKPIGGLKVSSDFESESALMRADVLKDVILALCFAYEEAVRDIFESGKSQKQAQECESPRRGVTH